MSDDLIKQASRAAKEAESTMNWQQQIITDQAHRIRQQDQQLEEMEQDLALASSCVTELEDTLDSLREGQEAPHV